MGSVLLRWAVWSVSYGITATVLCSGCNWFDLSADPATRFGWVPIVKIWWSPSFVAAMASLDFGMLILLTVLIDLPDLFDDSSGTPGTPGNPGQSSASSINQSSDAPDKLVAAAWAPSWKKCRWHGEPFMWLGRNSILFYMLCLMAAPWLPFLKPAFYELETFKPWQKVVNAMLCLGVWMICAWVLHIKRWYWVVGRETFACCCCSRSPSKESPRR